VGEHGLELEAGVTRHGRHGPERRLTRGVELHDSVFRARHDAMRDGEHQIGRERNAGAGIPARADDQDHVPADPASGHVRCATHHGARGRAGAQDQHEEGEAARH
jgi:hypothetical protein